MIRLLVVDDSPLICVLLIRALSAAPDIQVIGTASDPYIAREKIAALKPDVITLDIEMPRMDGLTFLAKIMKYFPLPVIIVSSLSGQGSMPAIRALEIGAMDVVKKPEAQQDLKEMAELLIEKIRTVAKINCQRKKHLEIPKPPMITREEVSGAEDQLLAIGASTGGTEAIAKTLQALPESTPGIVIVQHLPQYITGAFAQRLSQISRLQVREAKGGEILTAGLALIAPGNQHLAVERCGSGFKAVLKDGPKVFRQRPSVEVLFQSVAKYAGAKAVGVLLTGMGSDGAEGLLAMRQNGAVTIAQNEETCVVYGMPKAAVDLGGATHILPLEQIPRYIIRAFRDQRQAAASGGNTA